MKEKSVGGKDAVTLLSMLTVASYHHLALKGLCLFAFFVAYTVFSSGNRHRVRMTVMSRQINVVAAEMNNTVERRNAALLHTLLIYVHYPISSVMCIHLCVFFFSAA